MGKAKEPLNFSKPCLTKSDKLSPFSNLQNSNNSDLKSGEFLTLAELSNDHFNKHNIQLQNCATNTNSQSNFGMKVNTRPNFGNSFVQRIPNLDKEVVNLSLKVSNTQISLPNQVNVHSSKSENSMDRPKSNINSDWHIDLSKALRISNSAPEVLKKQTESVPEPDNFVIPFIDCDMEVPKQKLDLHFCNMDISSAAFVDNLNVKKPSKLGRALCRKYKRPEPYIINSEKELYKNVERFHFDRPSPDDNIINNLNHYK